MRNIWKSKNYYSNFVRPIVNYFSMAYIVNIGGENKQLKKILDLINLEQQNYIKKNNIELRKKKSQFFTEYEIAEQMVNFIDVNKYKYYKKIDILEPSAGFGMLIFCILNKFINELSIKEVNIVAYELDSKIFSSLNIILKEIEKYLLDKDICVKYKLINDDFTNETSEKKYDIIISNPPYSKISKNTSICDSLRNLNISIEQPNLYHIFIAKSLSLLKKEGEYIALTPRNYLVGKYTRNLREWILNNFSIINLHSFKSRAMFKEVNQEVIISRIIRLRKNEIIISNDLYKFKTKIDTIILDKDKNMLGLPLKENTLDLLNGLKSNGCKLKELGIKCNVGPVVQFRNLNYLSYIKEDTNYVPFLIPSDIKENKLFFEERNKKYKYINKKVNSKLINKQNIILIRKIVAKEDEEIIVGAVINKELFLCDYLGIDSNLLIFSGEKNELTLIECYGFYAYITSKYFKEYYLMINGTHTINVFELESMYFPQKEILIKIGLDVFKNKDVDCVVRKHLNL